jgi:hypothetical protein
MSGCLGVLRGRDGGRKREEGQGKEQPSRSTRKPNLVQGEKLLSQVRSTHHDPRAWWLRRGIKPIAPYRLDTQTGNLITHPPLTLTCIYASGPIAG